jgi:hypothetical protein
MSEQAVDKLAQRRHQVGVVTEGLGLAVLPGDQGIQQEQRTTRHFAPPQHHKLLEVLRSPSQDKFFMGHIVLPLTGFSQKLFDIFGGPVKQKRQHLRDRSVKFVSRCDNLLESVHCLVETQKDPFGATKQAL